MVEIVSRVPESGVFTKEDLEKIPGPYLHEIYLSLAEYALIELLSEKKIATFSVKRDLSQREKPDFYVLSLGGKYVSFRVTQNPGKAISAAEAHPGSEAIGIMDIDIPSQTKPTIVLKKDILKRIWKHKRKLTYSHF